MALQMESMGDRLICLVTASLRERLDLQPTQFQSSLSWIDSTCRTRTAGPAKHCPHLGHWCVGVDVEVMDVVGEEEVISSGDEGLLQVVDSRRVDMRR